MLCFSNLACRGLAYITYSLFCSPTFYSDIFIHMVGVLKFRATILDDLGNLRPRVCVLYPAPPGRLTAV